MFNEENTVENFVKDLLVKQGWTYIARKDIPRIDTDVIVEDYVKEALIKLNPEIEEIPERVDEILYRLRAIIISARGTGLVGANEEMTKWLKNEKTMPFGNNNEHTTVKLIDFDNFKNNFFVITTQYTFKNGSEKRPDLILLVNGFPLIIGEAKTPVRPAISWVDGAIQLEGYQNEIPTLFVPNMFCFATEGKEFRVGSIKLPIDKWQPWKKTTDAVFEQLDQVKNAVQLMLTPENIIEMLNNFSLFSIGKNGQKIKLMPRYQQFEAGKQIVRRVIDGKIKKGLIWHFQGSGKSLLMIYAANMLRKEPRLKSPTIIIVVDRIDLNSQISATFRASQIANTVTTESREELQKLLRQDTRKIIITTIHKFGEADSLLNDRENIIVLVDEAHRTQEGNLGKNMRQALPNAFFFGLTGTPINKRDRNTYWAFGADEDKTGYMNKYSFQQSLKDRATLPISFVPRPVDLKINKEEIDKTFAEMTDTISDNDKAQLSKHAAKFGVLAKSPDRIKNVVADMVQHFKTHVEPNGFKGQVVVFDREACDLYKKEFDKHMEPEETAIIMTVNPGDPPEWKQTYNLTTDEQEKIIDKYKDESHPLKLLIVTSKLLTGFDAPINQAMYLDKPLKDHTLLQAICRTNRTYKDKTRGLVIDYLGIFDNVAKALDFDVKEIQEVISNIEELKKEIPEAMNKCLSYFKDIDRSVEGYEGLLAAQDCLPSNELRDKFAADYSYLNRHWETVSPDPFLTKFEKDYSWLGQIYESIKPTSGNGKLIWHALGGKTLELINKNIEVNTIRDDLDEIMMDANVLDKVSDNEKKAKELEIKIVWRLHKHANNPKFKEIGKRLEELKEKHQKHLIESIDFLKELLDIAKEVVNLENTTEAEPVDNKKEALTQLFQECKVDTTPKIVERIVEDIDNIVKVTRFDGWQWSKVGEREIQKAIRKTLLKYKLHKEQDLFDKIYSYIREHY